MRALTGTKVTNPYDKAVKDKTTHTALAVTAFTIAAGSLVAIGAMGYYAQPCFSDNHYQAWDLISTSASGNTTRLGGVVTDHTIEQSNDWPIFIASLQDLFGYSLQATTAIDLKHYEKVEIGTFPVNSCVDLSVAVNFDMERSVLENLRTSINKTPNGLADSAGRGIGVLFAYGILIAAIVGGLTLCCGVHQTRMTSKAKQRMRSLGPHSGALLGSGLTHRTGMAPALAGDRDDRHDRDPEDPLRML